LTLQVVYLVVRRVEVNILNMQIWTQFLCVAVTLMAAADGHVIPGPLETSDLLLTPLVGSADKMDREEQMVVVQEETDGGEMERHMEGEVEAVGADVLVEGGENVVLQMEEATDMEEGDEPVEKNDLPLEEEEEEREEAEEVVWSGGCPSGWKQYRQRCFIYVSTIRTWTESERYCMSRGGNLASVHSVSENYFIQDMIRGITHDFPRTWIGGHDATQEGMWLWSDGTRLDYLNWNPGQPDNYSNGQNCLLMNFGDAKRWDDGTCTARLASVCARSI